MHYLSTYKVMRERPKTGFLENCILICCHTHTCEILSTFTRMNCSIMQWLSSWQVGPWQLCYLLRLLGIDSLQFLENYSSCFWDFDLLDLWTDHCHPILLTFRAILCYSDILQGSFRSVEQWRVASQDEKKSSGWVFIHSPFMSSCHAPGTQAVCFGCQRQWTLTSMVHSQAGMTSNF